MDKLKPSRFSVHLNEAELYNSHSNQMEFNRVRLLTPNLSRNQSVKKIFYDDSDEEDKVTYT